jgi:glucokinase
MEKGKVKKRVIGVDISFDRTVCAVVDLRGNVIAGDSFPTTDYPDINEYITVLCERIMQLIVANGGYELIRSVGVSAPSGNFLTGCIMNSPNFPWKGVIPLAAQMQDRLGLAVALGNDAHSNALGEYIYGSAHGMNNFIVITLGNGMGSCMFSNGMVHLGNDGFAGEVGHTCVMPDGRQCGCGKKGCLETYTAAKGIVMTAEEVLAENSLPSQMRQVDKLTPKIIAECCNLGDGMAIETFRRTGHYLGLGLANYASIFNPEAIILTGGITKAGQWLYEPTQIAFEENIFPNMKGQVKLIVSDLESYEREVLGASSLAWTVKEYSLFK